MTLPVKGRTPSFVKETARAGYTESVPAYPRRLLMRLQSQNNLSTVTIADVIISPVATYFSV
jgi:hypothetical protein